MHGSYGKVHVICYCIYKCQVSDKTVTLQVALTHFNAQDERETVSKITQLTYRKEIEDVMTINCGSHFK